MERCKSTIRRWKPGATGGLCVADLPPDVTTALGGLKQQRVRGTINGAEFASNVMAAGGGVLCLSVSTAVMSAAGVAVGDEVEIEVERAELSGAPGKRCAGGTGDARA